MAAVAKRNWTPVKKQGEQTIQYRTLGKDLTVSAVGLVAFSPLANGFLTARYTAESKFDPQEDYRSAMPQFKKEAFAQNGNLLALLEETAKAKNAAPGQISLAWMLNKKPYIVPIPGTRKLNRLAENLGAADIVLTAGEVAAIDEALDNMTMSNVFGGTRVIKR